MIAYRLLVSGFVQGVGFRKSVQLLANSLEIVGAVRNLENGEVEIHAQGEEAKLREFLVAVERIGSPARVENISKVNVAVQAGLALFRILR